MSSQTNAQLHTRSYVGFNGQLHEPGSSWQLLGNGYRAYNPVLMRFHNPDSLSPFDRGGRNAYCYCLDEPINHIDPSGANALAYFGGIALLGSATVLGTLAAKEDNDIIQGTLIAGAVIAGAAALGAFALGSGALQISRERPRFRSPSLQSERASQPAGGYINADDFADWVPTRFPGRDRGLQPDDLPPAYSPPVSPPQIAPPSSPPPSYSRADGERWGRILRAPAEAGGAGSHHLGSQLLAKLQRARVDSPPTVRRSRPRMLTDAVSARRRDFAMRMRDLRLGP